MEPRNKKIEKDLMSKFLVLATFEYRVIKLKRALTDMDEEKI